MKYRKLYCLMFLFLWATPLFSQMDWLNNKVFKSPDRKHQIWFYWGYNRSGYTLSDIHFRGDGYDFTLHDVVAKDRQSPFDASVYFNPQKVTIPQYNIRAGFFITDRLAITFGHDHMKYVAVTDQFLTMSGHIDSSASSAYAGTYDNTPMQFKTDFVRLEHTNGLNYVSAEADYSGRLWKSWGEKQALDFFVSYGLGILYPRSDVDLFNEEGANIFHIAGWGTSFQVGLRFDILPQLFLNATLKGGYINMPDVITLYGGDRASHHFWFLQRALTLGLSLNTFNKMQANKDPKGLKTFKS